MDGQRISRRGFLATCASGLVAGAAGCNVAPGSRSDDPADGSAGRFEQLREEASGPHAEVYAETIESVAQVRVYRDSPGTGNGTGFLYDDGYLVTNDHVVEGASDVYVRFPDGSWRDATVVGRDVYSDLAVLSARDAPAEATPLSVWGADPAIGTRVVAIGNPFGLSGSVSAGIVSGVDRTLPAPSNFTIPDAIQTDAPVNPGNSGGPLVSLDGTVVGVINSGSGDSIGFAISGPLTRRVAPALIDDGEFEHSFMGVRVRNVGPLLAEANDLGDASGAYVADTIEDGPAEGVLRGSTDSEESNGRTVDVGGDVIVALDDTEIRTRQELASYLALETDPGDALDVGLLRDGVPETVEVTLGARPAP